jgi:hypothetical protein
MHAEAMTLSRPSRTRFVRLRTPLSQSPAELRWLAPPANERHALASKERTSQPGAGAKFVTLIQAVVEQNRPRISIARESARQGAPAAALSAASVQRNHTLAFVEKITFARSARPAQVNTAAAVSVEFSPARSFATRRWSESVEPDQGAISLPQRLMRKHRRVEERPFLRPRDLKPMIAPPPTPEEPAVVHRTRRQVRQGFDAQPEAAPRQRALPPAPGVNVAQITDAVMQQLDRRLIAARERMGRI